MLKPLLIGSHTFRDMIEGGYLYIDKTKWIYELVRYPKGLYFLARPRRFGKSLMVSTLEEIFLGNRELFEGLWIAQSDYQWATHPVIRIDFSVMSIKSAEELKNALTEMIHRIAESHQVQIQGSQYYSQFVDLISKVAAKGKVVILIDEYDKPIVDNMADTEEAKQIQEVLKGFYTVIKAMDAKVRFVFLTGISKFSKVGIFSGLNNLTDLTMDHRFAGLLGLTEKELEQDLAAYSTVLADELNFSEAELKRQIKYWYNGFQFSRRGEAVYNPFSILNLFDKREFRNYWFETGTPTFLVKLIHEKEYDLPAIDRLQVGSSAFSSYNIDNLSVAALLFQTGYLTIKEYNERSHLYRLYYPNYEVERSFQESLLRSFSYFENGMTEAYLWRLVTALEKNAFDEFFAVLGIFFANIPYSLQIKKEKYYHSIFYLIFKLIGLNIQAEVETNQGRIDAVVELDDSVIIFEFKVDGSAEKALKQVKQTKYYQKYQLSGKDVFLVGVNFDTRKRTIGDWQIERDDKAIDLMQSSSWMQRT